MNKYELLADALFEKACPHKSNAGPNNIHFQINCRKCIATAFRDAVESQPIEKVTIGDFT